MIELAPATARDLPGIIELLRDANDTSYDLAAVAEEKCFGAGVGGSPRPLLATLEGRLVGVVVSCGRSVRILAVERRHRRRQVGSILLREAEKQIGESGQTVADAGAEAGNYFIPGIPAEDEGARRFFHLHGYEPLPEEPVNLLVSLRNNPRIDAPPITPVRRARADERGTVLAFAQKIFARAWRLEAERAFEHAEPTLFVAEQDGKIVGFSAHDANNRGLGFFGPAGVVKEHRGRGLGRDLLLASLRDLRRMRFTETIITWAAAHDFYRRACGAEIASRYLRLRKKLEP
jgi:mycothiol synthase